MARKALQPSIALPELEPAPVKRGPGRPRKLIPDTPPERPAPKPRKTPAPRRTSAELDSAIPPGSLAARLVGLMRERRLSAKALSERAGLSSDAVRALIRGRIESPRTRSVAQIAAALGLSVDQLMAGTTTVPLSVYDSAILAGDVREADIPEVDLRTRGDATTPENPLSLAPRRVWKMPLDVLEDRLLIPGKLVIARVPTGGIGGLDTGDYLLVDLATRSPRAGIYLVHDGERHSLSTVRQPVRGEVSAWRDGDDTPREEVLVGKIVGRWEWMP